MNKFSQHVSLGFTEEKFPPGTHICQIYSDVKERDQSINEYIRSGLEAGEHTALFYESFDEEKFSSYLESHGISLSEAEKSGNLQLASSHDVYFEDQQFNPERMLSLLKDFYTESKHAGCSACRVIGEMTPEIEQIKGGNRLLEYESKVSLLLKEHPVTAICQYNARDFDGTTIMDVLTVHPLMIVRGSVVKNPYFVPPEEFLQRDAR